MKKVFLILGLVFLLPGLMSATTLIPLSDEMLVREAQRIVVGTIMDKWVEYNPDYDLLVTYASLAVEDQIKGENDQSVVILKALGGKSGDMVNTVPSSPEIDKTDSRIVVFMYDDVDKYHSNIVGWEQGCLPVSQEGMLIKKNLSLDSYLQKIQSLVRAQ